MVGRETFEIRTDDSDIAKKDIAAEFIKQYYTRWSDIPHDILVEEAPEDVNLLEEFLAKDLNHKVRIYVPKKGENRALLKMAKADTSELVKTLNLRKASDEEKRGRLRSEIDYIFDRLERAGYPEIPRHKGEYRVEAYDISNTNGVDSVGAMVVFLGSRKVRKDYRRFKIKSVVGPDDYASLEEMLTRRFERANKGDPAFSTLPDIIFMDGGLGQVGSALKAFDVTGNMIPVVGLAKDEHHRTRAMVLPNAEEIDLKERPLLFKYAGTIQEEVHRFAIEYHRGLRGKSSISSVLDEIPGIGPTRRNALLAAFGSIDAIKAATEEELAAVKGMNAPVAANVREFFDK